jgi:hypothetical protein
MRRRSQALAKAIEHARAYLENREDLRATLGADTERTARTFIMQALAKGIAGPIASEIPEEHRTAHGMIKAALARGPRK